MTVATSQTWNPTQYSKNARFVSDLGMPVIELLAPRAGERILDLGCGDGPLTKKLADLGCQVVGVDSSQEMITAALSLGLEAYVMDGHSLQYEREFDAVFSNAALHWMKQPEKVISGVWKSLKPGGRFVGEFGGYGNVATIVAALESGLVKRGIDAKAFNPWYFPSIEEYKSLLEARGFTINTIMLVPRPTPLPGDLVGWLETFAKSYTAALPASEHIQFLEEAAGLCRTKLSSADGKWTADYVRLRFYATKPTESTVLRQRSFICQNSNHEKNLPIKTDSRAKSLLQGRLQDPLSYLGPHREKDSHVVRVFQPYASAISLMTARGNEPLQHIHPDGLFEWHGSDEPPHPYQLRIMEDGEERIAHDPYAFAPQISSFDLHLFNEGKLHQGYRVLGSHTMQIDGVAGVRFAVWAPNAERVSVVGEFNHWDGRINPMAVHGSSGVWELFIPDIAQGALYKFEIYNRAGALMVKTDPYANAFELRPDTAARAGVGITHTWQDAEWMKQRSNWDWLHAPLNVYEIHAGSWKRHPDGSVYTYRELAENLIPYLKDMGNTHVELMPISEHPLDESWGYQTTGYFAATSRFGSPDDLCHFIDSCHQAGIGVLLDWVPAHFPKDSFALARFDGTALYEHKDPRQGFHQDWGTYIFNYGRNEVKSFLLSSAHYWLSQFHFDGLRVDAVASMLYLDYSRKRGEWLPNKYGGHENLESIDFLRELNIMVHEAFPGALTLAEESTSWPAVSRPVYLGGLGFSMKWDMGWMNDTLSFMKHDPVHRRYHLNQLTFSQHYVYTENFMLPLSHDEVVHGKGSLLSKMPGDAWQKFANLRLLLIYQMTSPGKKLNFMGNEIGQGSEWNPQREIDWWQLEFESHRGIQNLARDLNHLYRDLPPLHELDFDQSGFSWVDCHDAERSLLSFQRHARNGETIIAAFNFTPVPRNRYRIGLPFNCAYREIFNSDSHYYGGSNMGNAGEIHAGQMPWMGQPYSAEIELPPLAGIVLVPTEPKLK